MNLAVKPSCTQLTTRNLFMHRLWRKLFCQRVWCKTLLPPPLGASLSVWKSPPAPSHSYAEGNKFAASLIFPSVCVSPANCLICSKWEGDASGKMKHLSEDDFSLKWREGLHQYLNGPVCPQRVGVCEPLCVYSRTFCSDQMCLQVWRNSSKVRTRNYNNSID